jgi:hypothetical protein
MPNPPATRTVELEAYEIELLEKARRKLVLETAIWFGQIQRELRAQEDRAALDRWTGRADEWTEPIPY